MPFEAVFEQVGGMEKGAAGAKVRVASDGSSVVMGRGDLCGIKDKRVSRKQVSVSLDGEKGTVKLVVEGVNPSGVARAGGPTTEAGDKTFAYLSKGATTTLNDGDEVLLLPPEYGNHRFVLRVTKTADAAPSRFDAFLEQIEADQDEGAGASEAVAADPAPGIDILFSFDTTGSMYECLDSVRAKIDGVISKIMGDMDVRVALIAHGDFYDADKTYLLKSLDFTSDLAAIKTFLGGIEQTNGGDGPEAYELVLREAQGFSWDAQRSKALVLIGDDVPHEPSYTDQAINWRDELTKLMDAHIKIYAVQANRNKAAAPFYEELAEKSGGFLIHLDELEWIEHMFVALCYRQHSPEKFENYRLDLIWEGKLSHGSPLNTLFMEMATPVINKQDPNYTGHTNKGWWDPEFFDHGTPRYRWVMSSKTWKRDSSGRKDARPKSKRKRAADDNGTDPADDGASTSAPKRQKRPPKPVVRITDTAAIARMTKKADVKRQLALRKKNPPPAYSGPAIVVGGGANDTLQAMKDRLLAVMACETQDEDP